MYEITGYDIISDLVDLADFDGNIEIDENSLTDVNYYQERDLGDSAKRLRALMLACHLKHQEGEDCLMQFIDKEISKKNQKKLLNKINKIFKEEEDREYAKKSIMTTEGRLCWFKSLLRFRKRYADLFDLAAFNGKETLTELMPKAYSALTLCYKISGICQEYDDIMFLLLGDYALQRIDGDCLWDYDNPQILRNEPQTDSDPF